MRPIHALRCSLSLTACLAAEFCPGNSRAATSPVTYYGNGGAGGTVASGRLVLQDNGTTVSGTFYKMPGASFDLDLVLFIDSVAGGFTDTTRFRDNITPGTTAISGYNTQMGKGSTATFAPGFAADYAIVLGVMPPNSGSDLYRLNAGGNGSFEKRANVNLYPRDLPNESSYTFQFTWASIGIGATDPHFFKFQSSYINCTAARTLQSFESLTGQPNFASVTYNNYNTYGVAPVPEMTTWALAIAGGLFFGRRLLAHARL